MQFQADVLETKLLRPEVLDTTALGAAYLAALGVGILETPADVMSAWLSEKSFKGDMSSVKSKNAIKLGRLHCRRLNLLPWGLR